MFSKIEYQALNSVHMANIISEKIHIEKNMELTLTQKKTVLYLVSLIQEEDTEIKEATISIADYFRLMGMGYSGGYKKELEKSILNFCSKCFWLPLKDGQYKIVCRWLETAEIDYEAGVLHLRLDRKLTPYFLNLAHQARTIFQLGYILQFKHKHTPDVYQFAARCKNLNAVYKMPIEDALMRFGCGKYKDYSSLNRWVLDRSIQEINEKSDLIVKMEPVRNGRNKTTHLAFMVRKKTGKALEKAEEWKKQLPKDKTIHEKVRDAFEDFIIDEAIDCGYLDYSDPDSIACFDPDEFVGWRSNVSKKKTG